MIYLDSAATTLQKPQSVSKNTAWAVNHLSSPGRGAHSTAIRAADWAYACRMEAARIFNVSNPENVVFTFNATHALNIAIKSLVHRDEKVVISGYEHNSVTRPLHAVGARICVASSEVFEPEMALHAFEHLLSAETALVVCNHVSNVFGYILPVERIAKACCDKNIPFVLDASQSAGVVDIDFKKSGADFICMPGHKGLYGPQGTGLLLCAKRPASFIQGGTGSQSLSLDMPDILPDSLEAGTHNMPGIAGLTAGLQFVSKNGTKKILTHERELIDQAANELIKMDRVRVFKSDFGYCQSGVLSFVVDGLTCESIGEMLSARGIAVRTGLHCAPLAHKTAGTIKTGTVRISVSYFNTKKDIGIFLDALDKIIRTDSVVRRRI